MRNGLYFLNRDEFLYTFFVFLDTFIKMFIAISNGKNGNHELSIEKFFDKTIIFYTICPVATIAQLVEHRFCKPAVISSSLIGGSIFWSFRVWNIGFLVKNNIEKSKILNFFLYGSVPEWSNGEDCKSFGFAFGGSNPSRPTIKRMYTFAQVVELVDPTVLEAVASRCKSSSLFLGTKKK